MVDVKTGIEGEFGRTSELCPWGGMYDGAYAFCDAWIGFSGAELLGAMYVRKSVGRVLTFVRGDRTGLIAAHSRVLKALGARRGYPR
jgi:hypothetical protein